jgi:hypothetical protein
MTHNLKDVKFEIFDKFKILESHNFKNLYHM